MLKKAGLLTVGVTAGLLAVAPIASAGESSHDGDHDKDRESSHDNDHGKKHHSKKHHDGDRDGKFNNTCVSGAGDVDNDTVGSGSLLGIGQVAGPVLSGSNVGVLNCTNILNDVLNDNDVAVSVLGGAAAGS